MTPNRPEPILHIGIEKTSTAFLQRILAETAELLLDNGFLYSRAARPGSVHDQLVFLASHRAETQRDLRRMYGLGSDNEARVLGEAAAADIEQEARDTPTPTKAFSCVHCSSRLREPEEVQRLADFLNATFPRTRVVVYVRNQIAMIPSHFSTTLRSGSHKPPELLSPYARINPSHYGSEHGHKGKTPILNLHKVGCILVSSGKK